MQSSASQVTSMAAWRAALRVCPASLSERFACAGSCHPQDPGGAWARLPQGTLRHWKASHVPSGLSRAVGTLLAPRHLPPQRVPPTDLEESPLLCLSISLAFGDRVVQSHVMGPVAPLEAAPTDGGVSASPSPAGAALGVCPHPASMLAPRAPAGLSSSGTHMLPATCGPPLSHLLLAYPGTRALSLVSATEHTGSRSPCQACAPRSSSSSLMSPLSQAPPCPLRATAWGGVGAERQAVRAGM